MSNKEMKDELQEDTSGVSDENTGIEEEINATMDKISSIFKYVPTKTTICKNATIKNG